MSLLDIQTRIATACAKSDRNPDDIVLIAVSKMQPASRIQSVLDAGHRVFGENRIQEAAERWPSLRERYDGVALHIVGPLQTNKARQAMQVAQAIHSLDRLRLADTIARLTQDLGHCPALFVQVNTGEEPQKSGVRPDDTDSFIAQCRQRDLPVCGLMCIPPQEEEPSLHFALLRKIATRNGLDSLSMGMSADFERAIQFGATHLRIGSAIFGQREHR